MRRARIVIAIIAVLAFVFWLRPLAVFEVVRAALLYARGVRGGYAQVGGQRIHYFVAGGGAPLVLVHGLASSGADWGPLIPDLAKARRVYAIDLLGYGKSDKPPGGDYSIAAQAEVVRGLLDALPVARADVIGVSMGGWIAMRLAATHPERVARLVLIDSAGFKFETPLAETTFTPSTVEQLQYVLDLQTKRAQHLPRFIARDFLREVREDAPVIRASMRAMLSGRDLMDGRVSAIRMPTLLVWGTADRITPLAVGLRMQRELPNAQLVLAPGCGHLAVLECRDAYMPRLHAFLKCGGHAAAVTR
jgi:pimeloyl-ACP methyl ester carboxylesterase